MECVVEHLTVEGNFSLASLTMLLLNAMY